MAGRFMHSDGMQARHSTTASSEEATESRRSPYLVGGRSSERPNISSSSTAAVAATASEENTAVPTPFANERGQDSFLLGSGLGTGFFAQVPSYGTMAGMLPSIGMPSIGMPSIGIGMPSLASISMGALPNISVPTFTVPNLSQFSNLTQLPQLPQFSLPSLPQFMRAGALPKRSWTQLRDSVRNTHQRLGELNVRVPFAFACRYHPAPPGSGNTASTRVRLYFCSSTGQGSESNFFYCDIDLSQNYLESDTFEDDDQTTTCEQSAEHGGLPSTMSSHSVTNYLPSSHPSHPNKLIPQVTPPCPGPWTATTLHYANSTATNPTVAHSMISQTTQQLTADHKCRGAGGSGDAPPETHDQMENNISPLLIPATMSAPNAATDAEMTDGNNSDSNASSILNGSSASNAFLSAMLNSPRPAQWNPEKEGHFPWKSLSTRLSSSSSTGLNKESSNTLLKESKSSHIARRLSAQSANKTITTIRRSPSKANDNNVQSSQSTSASNSASGTSNQSEALQQERKRIMLTGITSYDHHEPSGSFLYSSQGRLYCFHDHLRPSSSTPSNTSIPSPSSSTSSLSSSPNNNNNGNSNKRIARDSPPSEWIQSPMSFVTRRLPSTISVPKSNPQICPSNPDWVAFLCAGDIYLSDRKLGKEFRLTHTCRAFADGVTLSAGMPSYIIQEEFRRYQGFWWQPVVSQEVASKDLTSDKPVIYTLLYEEIDESDVELVKIPNLNGGLDEYRFSRTGLKNAVSTLKTVTFRATGGLIDPNTIFSDDLYCGRLDVVFPDYEYLVRVGWHSRDAIYAQLLNRSQNELILVLFSNIGGFPPQILYTEASVNHWINVADSVLFLPHVQSSCTQSYQRRYTGTHMAYLDAHRSADDNNEDTQDECDLQVGSVIEFIWTSEETGYRHLYYIAAAISNKTTINGAHNVSSHFCGVTSPPAESGQGKDTTEPDQAGWEAECDTDLAMDSKSVKSYDEMLYEDASQNDNKSPSHKSLSPVTSDADMSSNFQGLASRYDCPVYSDLLCKRAITHGDWEVIDRDLWLDPHRELVYFIGLRDSPIERHLYVTHFGNLRLRLPESKQHNENGLSTKNENKESLNSKKSFPEIKLLTQLNFSHTVHLFIPPSSPRTKTCTKTVSNTPQTTFFVDIMSNVRIPPVAFVQKLKFNSFCNGPSSVSLPTSEKVGFLLTNKIRQSIRILNEQVSFVCPQSELLPTVNKPELFTYRLRSGHTVYGLIFKPEFHVEDALCPVLLDIYGGPEVQLVTNSFKAVHHVRRHILVSNGYAVVCMDVRGSRHRGTEFEGHIRHRMGQVEIPDHVEVMEWLLETRPYMDRSRICVHGWSYGGYLSLMALAQRPDFFRVAIAGAPVTSWTLYDTGYTERYMGTPHEQPDAFTKGSVLNYINQFPDETGRLMIVHGSIDENVHFTHTSTLINALIGAGKPYELQIYPAERHSIRNRPCSEHYETKLLAFLQDNLSYIPN